MGFKSKTWVAIVAVVASVSTAFFGGSIAAQAYTAADFDPGYIISDAAFSDSSAMTEAQIQAFLVAQEPTCPALNGMPCMRNYTTTSTSRAASPSGQCQAYEGAASESAARVIFKVAQACSINPQVLLVLLQKEQGLVTATSPTLAKYKIATGYGCPDTAACDTQYYGFYNQVYKAAWQFREYTIHPSSWRYKIGINAIQYSTVPPPTCLAPLVNVRNQATANLYNYTPYQPNAAAMANLTGMGDGCSSYGNRNFWVYFNNWFGSPISYDNPIANVEALAAVPGKIHVAGWALDPNTAASIDVHIYVNGIGTPFTASNSRPDVGAAYGLGDAHGFDVTVPVRAPGPQDVCIYAINQGPGANALIGCSTVIAQSGSPTGFVDSSVGALGAITTSGWAVDPDSIDPVSVHIYVDSVGVAYSANQSRPDIGAAFPGYGSAHGYSYTVNAAPGPHTVCVYGINIGVGANVLLGCRAVTVPGGSPIGVVDSVVSTPGTITTSGWTLDPDSAASIPVHIYVDSAGIAYTADGSRPDIAQIFAGYGANHGFVESVPATPGTHNVCAYAINLGAGANVLLGCKSVVALSGSPVGIVDSVTASNGAITAAGWTYDPDTAAPINVRITVDSVGTVFAANQSRPDVGVVFPVFGPTHGFSQVIPTAPGSHQVCVYGVNIGPGADVLLGCRGVTL